MYNQELKERFISELNVSDNRKKQIRVLFSSIERFENEWNADLCTQKAVVLKDALTQITGARVSSYLDRMLYLKKYVSWCVDNNVPNACYEVFKIKELGNDKLKSQTVSSPMHLKMYLDALFSNDVEGSVGCIYRCYYWLAFSGIKDSDALNIKAKNVDFKKMAVVYNGIEYPIYGEAAETFKKCVSAKRFRVENPNASAKIITYKDRAPGDLLLRGLSQPKNTTAYRVEISRRKKKMSDKNIEILNELNLSYSTVYLSGIFCRAREKEVVGITPDFTEDAVRFMSGKEYTSATGVNEEEVWRKRIAKRYLKDYNRWKDAYFNRD